MNIDWRKLTAHLSLWLMAEICLTLVGLDNLADYSEYAFAYRFRQMTALVSLEA